jgi:hypothetical protein
VRAELEEQTRQRLGTNWSFTVCDDRCPQCRRYMPDATSPPHFCDECLHAAPGWSAYDAAQRILEGPQ